MANIIVLGTAAMGAVGGVLATGLAVASTIFKTESDPRVDELLEVLPGANCGACGFPGCAGLAGALAKGQAPAGACVVGGAAVARKVAAILGAEVGELPERRVARLLCQGGRSQAVERAAYAGVADCRAADLVQGGPKGCRYGCLGFGNCVAACSFGAMRLGPAGLPEVDERKCTACGKCVSACPRELLVLLPEAVGTYVACASKARGPEVRPVCKVGCIACGICVKSCPEQCITLEQNLARIDPSRCTDCGICVAKCPTKAIADRSTAKRTMEVATAAAGAAAPGAGVVAQG
ncbi:MAG: RnfABCDGE type electron transport complex subunit B [Chitinophagales bacterium]